MEIKRVILTIADDEFRKLKNAKEEAIITGKAKNWNDFILKKCGVRK